MNVFITLWYKPKEAISHIVSSEREFILIYYVISFKLCMTRILQDFEKYKEFGGIGILIVLILSTILGGLFIQYVTSYIYWLIGKLLRGKADYNTLRKVYSYALLPYLINVVYFVIVFGIFVSKGMTDLNVLRINNIAALIVWILVIRTFVIGLKEIQYYSYEYAILNVVIPGLITGLIIYGNDI